jgi:hypothetical protein
VLIADYLTDIAPPLSRQCLRSRESAAADSVTDLTYDNSPQSHHSFQAKRRGRSRPQVDRSGNTVEIVSGRIGGYDYLSVEANAPQPAERQLPHVSVFGAVSKRERAGAPSV